MKEILCIDFDDVIIKTKPLVEAIIEKIEFNGSEKYFQTIQRYYYDGFIDLETKKFLEDKHFDYKDRILEEVDDKYKNLIDYRKVISIDNIYCNAVEYINFLKRSNRYSKIYILTHCNVQREIDAKLEFMNKYCPGIEVIAVPFHKDKYAEGVKRKRTSKAEYLKEYLGIDSISNCTLIDDSPSNGRDWTAHGGTYIKYNPNTSKDYSKKEADTLFPYDIMLMSEQPKLGRGR